MHRAETKKQAHSFRCVWIWDDEARNRIRKREVTIWFELSQRRLCLSFCSVYLIYGLGYSDDVHEKAKSLYLVHRALWWRFGPSRAVETSMLLSFSGAFAVFERKSANIAMSSWVCRVSSLPAFMLEQHAVNLGTLSRHDQDGGDPKDRWRSLVSVHATIGVSQRSVHDMIPGSNVVLSSCFSFTSWALFTLVHPTDNQSTEVRRTLSACKKSFRRGSRVLKLAVHVFGKSFFGSTMPLQRMLKSFSSPSISLNRSNSTIHE